MSPQKYIKGIFFGHECDCKFCMFWVKKSSFNSLLELAEDVLYVCSFILASLSNENNFPYFTLIQTYYILNVLLI